MNETIADSNPMLLVTINVQDINRVLHLDLTDVTEK